MSSASAKSGTSSPGREQDSALPHEHQLQPLAEMAVQQAPVAARVGVGEARAVAALEDVEAVVVGDQRSVRIDRIAVIYGRREVDDLPIAYDRSTHPGVVAIGQANAVCVLPPTRPGHTEVDAVAKRSGAARLPCDGGSPCSGPGSFRVCADGGRRAGRSFAFTHAIPTMISPIGQQGERRGSELPVET
jgi:hypothetical protein